MGRGRAKAKQTKVARELKYNAPQTDLDALRAELSGAKPQNGHARPPADDDDDPFAKYDDDKG
ncbi:MAG TPA: DUF3073 domain-containing protein [Actinobacteria bacterium]|jgi:hypothetical protein|nr:DUF3073 domain-containing protein [Actinomycetota bacterium]